MFNSNAKKRLTIFNEQKMHMVHYDNALGHAQLLSMQAWDTCIMPMDGHLPDLFYFNMPKYRNPRNDRKGKNMTLSE